MKNQCIKVLNKEHGKKVIEYFKSLGVDTSELTGESVGKYYGIFDSKFNIYDEPRNSEVIELPTEEREFKRGDKVLVWYGDGNEKNAVERIFLTKIDGAFYPYIVKHLPNELNFLTVGYTHCKHNSVELTLQDISYGKGVGVDPKLIKIV